MKIRSAFLLQVASAVIPSLILLSVVPLIKNRLSLDAFAGFSIIVSSIGLLAMLDGGLGRAATYFVSVTRLKNGEFRARAVLLGGIAVGIGFAVVVMVAGAALLDFFNGEALMTARDAICVLLLFCPAFVIGAVLKGSLEGQQRFAMSTGLQLAYGVVIGIAPVFLIYHPADFLLYAWLVGAARIGLLSVLLYTTGLLTSRTFRFTRTLNIHANRLFHYSKWLFFSNIIGLCIIFADRFAIIGYFNSSTVAAYVLPMELISRSQLLVAAFCSVIFPRIVIHIQRSTGHIFDALISDAQGFVIAANVVIGFLCLPIMEPLMEWWLGHELAAQAAEITLVGIVGLAFISSSAISMLAINGMGHTRQVAVLHAIELTIYLGLLCVAAWYASIHFLLAAWLFRMAFDAFGMKLILNSLGGQTLGCMPIRDDKAVYRWAVLGALTFTLLTIIFSAPIMSSSTRLWGTAAGAACSTATLLNFGLRLRASMSISSNRRFSIL